MSFWSVLSNIRENLENKFTHNASKAVNDPDDGKQAEQDANKGGEDTSSTARDGANDEIGKHDPAWKGVKDLSDKALETVPKVEAAAKYGWLKFIGGITALFVFISAYSLHNNLGGPTPEQIRMYNTERTIAIQGEQIRQMEGVMVSTEEFTALSSGLLAAPPPYIPDAPVAAEAAPAPALPAAVAAIADEPATVDVTDSDGYTRTVNTTVGTVYRNSTPTVRAQIETPAPIHHDYNDSITTDPNSCFVRHCLSPHKDITVNAVDGNGNKFGSATVKY
jgi:hypothetical protein